ncbi:MAG: hypothetical protein LUD14_12630 [Clostridiales bacterium]|nr:hypothetical protein [Clostridiales bacterium]
MTVNIRFCGGCNPRYDRGAFARRLIRDYPNLTFIYNAETDTDAVILLCGCSAACARVPESFGTFGRVTVRGEEDRGRLYSFLDSLSLGSDSLI